METEPLRKLTKIRKGGGNNEPSLPCPFSRLTRDLSISKWQRGSAFLWLVTERLAHVDGTFSVGLRLYYLEWSVFLFTSNVAHCQRQAADSVKTVMKFGSDKPGEITFGDAVCLSPLECVVGWGLPTNTPRSRLSYIHTRCVCVFLLSWKTWGSSPHRKTLLLAGLQSFEHSMLSFIWTVFPVLV